MRLHESAVRTLRVGSAALTCIALLAVAGSLAHAAEPRSFDTAEAAFQALISALKNRDSTAIAGLLGGVDLLTSGDAKADAADRSAFLEAYAAKHALVPGEDGALVLSVGESDWPMPIPVVQRGEKWRFDTEAGIAELNHRRIGRNELGTIEVCRGLVHAQQEYASTGHDGVAPGAYAMKFRSDPGRQNGLYWEVAEGKPPSPLGPLVADASTEGYSLGSGAPGPYHGYLYRMLAGQGPNAQGGARSYAADGVWRNGFAMLAYPVEYGTSGVMTFIVNQDGVVFQKDLGEDTASLAARIAEFDPDPSWTPVQ